MPTPEPRDIPVFILCGGMGTRLGEGASGPPKPMLDVGGKPMLLHVMGWYGRFGFQYFSLRLTTIFSPSAQLTKL